MRGRLARHCVTAVAFSFLILGGSAYAQDADGATSDDSSRDVSSPAAYSRTVGEIGAFRSIAAEDRPRRVSTTSVEMVPVPGMELGVPTVRGSQMLVTFNAECKASSPAGGNAGVAVQLRVNGVPVPYLGTEDALIFCGDKPFYFETHSYQWFVRARTRRPVVTVHFARIGADDAVAELSDRILTVMYQPRP